jgi:hypothetical protein
VSDVVEREAAVEVEAASIAACSRCGATPTAVQTLLDSRKGRTVKSCDASAAGKLGEKTHNYVFAAGT